MMKISLIQQAMWKRGNNNPFSTVSATLEMLFRNYSSLRARAKKITRHQSDPLQIADFCFVCLKFIKDISNCPVLHSNSQFKRDKTIARIFRGFAKRLQRCIDFSFRLCCSVNRFFSFVFFRRMISLRRKNSQRMYEKARSRVHWEP